MAPTLPGPAFWEKTYGIESFDEFFSEIGRYIPGITFWGFGLDKTALSESAYQNPSAGPGLAAVIIAAAKYSGPTDEKALSRIQATAGTAASVIGGGPMTQLVIPGCFQVAIHGKAGGSDVVNVIGVQNPGGDAAGAAAAVRTAWKVTSGPLNNLSSLYTLDSFVATDIGSSNGQIVTLTDTTAGGQTTGNSFATAGACALIKWNGGTRSRSARGRIYFGPLTESQINADGRTVVGAFQTTINTAFANFRSSLSSSGYPLVVLSRTLSQAFPITSSTCENTIATQRRRIRS